MKKDMIYPNCILCNTIIDLTDDEVQDYNEENGTNLPSYEIANIFRYIEVEEFFENIKYSSLKDEKVVILGTLGLWNGRHEIEPCVCSDIEKAINKCIGKADDFCIKQEKGYIFVDAYHHDGTNNFIIKLLNDKGINTKKGDLSKKYYHKRFKGYLI